MAPRCTCLFEYHQVLFVPPFLRATPAVSGAWPSARTARPSCLGPPTTPSGELGEYVRKLQEGASHRNRALPFEDTRLIPLGHMPTEPFPRMEHGKLPGSCISPSL